MSWRGDSPSWTDDEWCVEGLRPTFLWDELIDSSDLSEDAKTIIRARTYRNAYGDRPEFCQLCGAWPEGQYEADAIQAHHMDYSDHEHLLWLCPACHVEIHRRARNLLV